MSVGDIVWEKVTLREISHYRDVAAPFRKNMPGRTDL